MTFSRRTRSRPRLLLSIILVLVFGAGCFFAGYKLQAKLTAEALMTAYAKYVERLPSHKQELEQGVIAQVQRTDYAKLNQIHLPEDIAARREAALAYIFQGIPEAMARLPDKVEQNVLFPPLADLDNLAGIDRLTVDMDYGVDSVVLHLKPVKSNSCLMLYQEGHRDSVLARKAFLGKMLAEGCDVLGLSLPLTGGLNSRPEVDHPRFGRILFNDPDDLRFLDSAQSSSLHYFILPMVAALNQALSEQNYQRVGATGFSGGGWAVEILAAIDPRITASYAVAGSTPEAVHAAMPGWGSPEQVDARFYEIANYVELYTMGAAGSGRHQIQFFNDTDPCCFSGHNWRAYRDAVAERAAALGGSFRLLSYGDAQHNLSAPVAQAIADDFMARSKPLPLGVVDPG